MSKLVILKDELTTHDEGLKATLEKILIRFYGKLEQDIMIGFFFQGKDIKHIIEAQKKLLLMVMGVAKNYDGKSVSQAHMALPPILKGHFDRRMVILTDTLKEFKLSEGAIKEWVGFEKQFRNVIVK